MKKGGGGSGLVARTLDRLLLRNVLRPNAPIADILKAPPSLFSNTFSYLYYLLYFFFTMQVALASGLVLLVNMCVAFNAPDTYIFLYYIYYIY